MRTYAKIANLYVVITSMILLFVCVMHPDVNGDCAGAGGIASALLCFIGMGNLTYNKDL